ncbi:MAG: hypothetical protein IKK33_09845 [Lachnospiraceae bacterium]|nr:hypothetical protein [Lachnospiraceae bacterium]
MAIQLEKKQKINKILQFVFPVFLFLYPLRHICFGMGWTDTGYNYGNFVYMDYMDPMWLFSTYLSNGLGNLFTKLPLGNTMLGLNLYTGLFISGLAVAGYFFFVKVIKLSMYITFVGEFIAVNLCWCPTALLYNYLSYALLGTGVVLLYFGLMKSKRSPLFFVLAGVALGVNVFVRFPNLTNMALIVAVWAMGIIRKEKVVTILRQTGLCILGYLIGLGGCLGLISLKYGAGNYVQGIIRLLSMPSEAEDYTVVSMVMQQIQNYWQNIIWLGYLALFMLLGTIVYQILPKSWKWIKNVGYVGAVFCGFYFLWAKNMFNLEYNTYMSMFQWAAMLLTATLTAGVVIIFGKGFTEQEKLVSGLNVLVILITPLGSNNHLYLAMNNLFLVAPFTLWMIYRFFKWIPDVWKVKKWEISTYTLKAMLGCILFMILAQTTMFGNEFVFLEANGGINSRKSLDTKVENNDILKGMRMEKERAQIISEISAYVKENDLQGGEIILYGDIPVMSYILQMPFALSAWPDMRSYNYTVMEADLQAIEDGAVQGNRELPIILLEKKQGTYVVSGKEGLKELSYEDKVITVLESDKKLQLLSRMIERQNYRLTFENDKFMLFEAAQEE